MNSANKENYLDIVRHMTELEKGIARKAPAARSAEETHLATMVENLRTNPPTITVNTKGGGTKDEVPNTMKKALGID